MQNNVALLFSVFLFSVVACLPAVAQSQNVIKPDKHLKGGIVTSRLINTPWQSTPSPGFAIGLSLDFRMNPLISVQPEVLYVQKGGRERVSSLDTEFDLTLDYVEIPILTQIHLPTLGAVHPHFYVGPYASFLLENFANIELPESNQFTPDQFVEQVSNNDFGAVLGVGTDLDFTFNTMTAEIRYSTGLADMFDQSQSFSPRNGTLMFLVGFEF